MQIKFDGKTQQQRILFIQGEHNQTLVNFVLPLEYGEQTLAGLAWIVRTVNLCTEEYYQYSLLGTADENGVTLPWRVEKYTTASPGDLEITLVGRQGDQVVAKFVLSGATVKRNTTGAVAPQENYIEVVLAQMDSRIEQMQAIAMKPTTVSEATGNFMTWDEATAAYKDTGIRAVGPEGPVGPPGAPGTGLTILGHYDSFAELQAAVTSPKAGDAYNVGTTAPYDVYIYDGQKGWVNNGPLGATTPKTATGTAITLTDVIKDSAITSLELYGKSTQDGTPSPEAPVEIVSQDVGGVWAGGNNLFRGIGVPNDEEGYYLSSGGEVTNDGFVRFYANGAASVALLRRIYLSTMPFVQPDTTYKLLTEIRNVKDAGARNFMASGYLSAQPANRAFYSVAIAPSEIIDGAKIIRDVTSLPTLDGVEQGWLSYIEIPAGETCDFEARISIYPADYDVTEYEPYVGQTYTVNKTLRGIPVESGGNYTDENGQQWICDTYNVATGEYVQRVKELVLDGTEMWQANVTRDGAAYYMAIFPGDVVTSALEDVNGPILCTHYKNTTNKIISSGEAVGISTGYGKYILIAFYDPAYNTADVSPWTAHLAELYTAGAPVIVDYALAEPIVTKVPAHYVTPPSPTCNILAGGAQMEVEYNNVAGGAKRVYFALSDPGPREIPYTWAEISEMCKAADFKEIRHGDWKDITLTGEFYDAAADTTKSINTLCRMEAAGIDSYYRFGDAMVPHHIDFIGKDCIPGGLMYNATNTNAGGFIGSMLHTTLNGENGIQALLPPDVAAVIIEKRALCETKTGTDATGWAWNNLGKLWLPSEFEVWGGRIWAETWGCGQAIHYPIFNDGTLNHIIKGDGHNGSRVPWWCASSMAGSAAHFCHVGYSGHPYHTSATSGIRVLLCFRVA